MDKMASLVHCCNLDLRAISYRAIFYNSRKSGLQSSRNYFCTCLQKRKEGNVLFNDALNTFYLRRGEYGK